MLACIDAHAARYARYIHPLLSVSVDFYVRLFVRVRSGAAQAKENALCVHVWQYIIHVNCRKRSMFYQCVTCDSRVVQPLMQRRIDKSTGKHSVKYSPAHAVHGTAECEFCGSAMIVS
jgi:tRNA (guanine26-N2/guanine27-N2)-dimethyltransferase